MALIIFLLISGLRSAVRTLRVFRCNDGEQTRNLFVLCNMGL